MMGAAALDPAPAPAAAASDEWESAEEAVLIEELMRGRSAAPPPPPAAATAVAATPTAAPGLPSRPPQWAPPRLGDCGTPRVTRAGLRGPPARDAASRAEAAAAAGAEDEEEAEAPMPWGWWWWGWGIAPQPPPQEGGGQGCPLPPAPPLLLAMLWRHPGVGRGVGGWLETGEGEDDADWPIPRGCPATAAAAVADAGPERVWEAGSSAAEAASRDWREKREEEKAGEG